MRRISLFIVIMSLAMVLALNSSSVFAEEDACIACHKKVSPGRVSDWKVSKHSEEGITCSDCHGTKHKDAGDYTDGPP
jgi:uncharacterized CHY-type Zn-finger protein